MMPVSLATVVRALPSTPLPAPVRERLERCFGEPLGNVRIAAGPAAARLARVCGAGAFALHERVVLGATAAGTDGPAGLALLAHEVAHLLQQRAGRQPGAVLASSAALEDEADAAASAALDGRPFSCRLAADPAEPARWELAGHYYLPYLMLLNFGIEQDRARRMAQYCWLADQVKEFDAAHIGWRCFGYSSPWHHADDNMSKYGKYSYKSEEQWVRCVHKGLHVLTGGDAIAETKRRGDLFIDATRYGTLAAGLALHPYGDCFSHRQMSGLFSDGRETMSGKLVPFGHARDFGEADHIWHPERGGIFCDYVRGLFNLFKQWGKTPQRKVDDILAAMVPLLDGLPLVSDRLDDPKAGQAELAKQPKRPKIVDWKEVSADARKLSERTKLRDEKSCAAHMGLVAETLLNKSLRNASDRTNLSDELRPWDEYWAATQGDLRRDTGINDGEYVYYLVQSWAAMWAGLNLPRSPRLLSAGLPAAELFQGAIRALK